MTTLKLDRMIARVNAMLVRAERAEEIMRLTSLLVMLQKEYIAELEKAIKNKKRAA
jgi:hypothetical protein